MANPNGSVPGQEYVCTEHDKNGNCKKGKGKWQETGYYEETISTYASWQGCVETRPHPYNVDDTPAQGGTFVEGCFTIEPTSIGMKVLGAVTGRRFMHSWLESSLENLRIAAAPQATAPGPG